VTWLFRISAALNLGLLGVAAFVLRPTPRATPTETSTAAPTNSSFIGKAIPTNALVQTNIPEQVYVTNAFRWDAIESTNYAELIANLRAVNCPELTIRDIIYGDADRRYATLEFEMVEPVSFWLAGRARAEATRSARTNRSAAQAALVTEVSSLFGLEWSPEERETHEPQIQALARMLAGPATDAEYDQIWRWFMTTMRRSEHFRDSRQHLLLPADEQAWAAEVADRCAQLQQSLTPTTFAEFQARTALVEEVMANNTLHLRDLDLTPDELRSLSQLKILEFGWLEELFRLDRNRSEEETEARRVAFASAAQGSLSPDHYEEFIRVQDENYRELLDFVLNQKLSRTVAQQVYQIKQLATAEFNRLSARPDEPEAVAAAAELQLTTADSVRRLLGAEAFKSYAARHGRWVNDLSKP